MEVEEEILSDEKNAVAAFAIVGDGGEIGLRMDGGKFPSFAAVACKGEVWAVVLGMLVVSSGDYAVKGVAESDGENACGFGTMEDWSRGDFPRLATIRGMKDASGFASGGEPDVGVGGG